MRDIHTNIQTEIKTETIDLGRYTDRHEDEKEVEIQREKNRIYKKKYKEKTRLMPNKTSDTSVKKKTSCRDGPATLSITTPSIMALSITINQTRHSALWHSA